MKRTIGTLKVDDQELIDRAEAAYQNPINQPASGFGRVFRRGGAVHVTVENTHGPLATFEAVDNAGELELIEA